MFCWHLFHEESERVEEDSFNSIAAAFIAGNNITYQFEVQEMLYEAKNAACKPSVLSKEGNLQTHADLRPLELWTASSIFHNRQVT